MDILTHGLSVIAAGTVLAAFANRRLRTKIAIITIGGLGALLPDIDAISLWSKFDTTFGRFFGLNHSGKIIYSETFWYSHHAFFHSIMGGLIISLILLLGTYFLKTHYKNVSFISIRTFFNANKFLIAAFCAGFIIHLIEDMPTPASTWGGVNLFWPVKTYIGGWGNIWWWNNYDIFLIVCGVIFVNVIMLGINRYTKGKSGKFALIAFVIGFISVVIQIKTRTFDFSYEGHTLQYQQFELKSKEIQQQILGQRIYKIMNSLDDKLPFYF